MPLTEKNPHALTDCIMCMVLITITCVKCKGKPKEEVKLYKAFITERLLVFCKINTHNGQ